jgi:glycosyltransferase involved in cell wall biosynthesis
VRFVFLNQYYAPAEAATAQLLTDVCEHLAAEGHRVSVVCSRRSYPDPSIVYPASETIRGVRVVRTWTTGFGRSTRWGRLVDYAGFMLAASRAVAVERSVDVVVSLTTPPFLNGLGLVAARLRDARAVFWIMDIYPELAFELGVLRRGGLIGRGLARLADAGMRRADGVIALGETMASRLRSVDGARIRVVHNWADGDLVQPRPSAESSLRASWGWGDRFVVLYSGNLGLAHEFETLLDAAERLRDDGDVLFAFVGSGPRRADVEREVARRGLSNVDFRPHVEREALGDSLSAGDLHVVTMREGIAGLVVPSKIYGILAAGRPTAYVGPPECEVARILEAGDCGVRIGIGDGSALAEAIRAYRETPARRIEEGRRARALFDRSYSKQRALRGLDCAFAAFAEREE